MRKVLLVVESPVKARLIRKYLWKMGIRSEVFATKGHVKDLPVKRFGLDFRVSETGKPEIVMEFFARGKVLKQLLEFVKKGDFEEVFLATDPDREGEMIAYHIKEELVRAGFSERKIFRVRFYSITEGEIARALKEKGDINSNLVEAQMARRILDRIVGYVLSPLVSRSLGQTVSVGRVQTPALRMVVEKEESIENFSSEPYWYFWGFFTPLYAAGLSYAFTARTENIFNSEIARVVYRECFSKQPVFFKIKSIKEEKRKIYPPRPLTTGKMLSVAGKYLGFSTWGAMKIAQRLYEKGYTTYVRTDSYRVSDEGLRLAENYILNNFGSEYLNLNDYQDYSERFAQEAHECIRPVVILDRGILEKERLSLNELRLLKLISSYFFASQMKEAEVLERKIELVPVLSSDQEKRLRKSLKKITGSDDFSAVVRFNAESRKVLFDGWTRLLKVEGNVENRNEILFSFKEGQELGAEVRVKMEKTSPPERLGEDDLVKELERFSIGRPSTYATVIDTLKRRRYVLVDEERKLRPTFLGKKLVNHLRRKRSFVLDYDFTAEVESKLDKIVEGKFSKEDVVFEVLQKTMLSNYLRKCVISKKRQNKKKRTEEKAGLSKKF